MNVQFKCMMVPNMRDTHRSIPKSDRSLNAENA